VNLAIETHGLSKRYGQQRALIGLDVTVAAGTVFGMIGPNGAGKTTTMRLLLDIIRPSHGHVRVLGADPRTGGPALRRRIGFLPGEFRVTGRATGRELLEFYARVSGTVGSDAIGDLAGRLDLDLTRPAATLSKGNKQKIGLVQAFMHRPDLLLLDEPTSGLDPLVQREFLAMVREARDRGQTVFLSSHVLSEIQHVADTVAILRAGKLVTTATVEGLRESAVRHVRVTVDAGEAAALQAELAALPQVADLASSPGASGVGGVTLAASIASNLHDVVRVISRYRVLDLVAEEADLEEAVLRYYGTDLREGDEPA
jgi:ABC-2 type transport system ATP-binding protein